MARFGGMACGWVGLLASISKFLPFTVFGLTATVAGIVALKLPETSGPKAAKGKLPDTISEGEEVGLTRLCGPC